MNHSEFKIGERFACGGKTWQVTDVGTRVVIAVDLSPVEVTRTVTFLGRYQSVMKRLEGVDDWLSGPPYAIAEEVFDENDILGCEAMS